jgi:hypothetical protein
LDNTTRVNRSLHFDVQCTRAKPYWRTTRFAQETIDSVFSSTPLQRSRTPKIQDQCHHTIEKARHSSNTGCIQRRFESQQTLEDRSSRYQSEKSGSKIQVPVLRQPDRVVRQPEESSSIEACTYLQPLIHSTPYILTSIVKKAVTMLCATGKRRRIGLQQAKR